MNPINFNNAYYIKLGAGGCWEKSSIDEGKIRLGWRKQSLIDINQRNWSVISEQLQKSCTTKSLATRDLHALMFIVDSTSDDVWVTFHASKLWWCWPGEATIFEDAISKYRKVDGIWRDKDVSSNPLLVNQIPGSLSKVQRFQGTVCQIKAVEDLKRLLNDQYSQAYKEVANAKLTLESKVAESLKGLHWKDFETLVDLVSRNAGWRRMSMLGETMKYVDMELQEPVT